MNNSVLNLFRTLTVAATLGLGACADNKNENNATIDYNSVLSGAQALTVSDTTISGTGSLVFTSSLGALASGKHFDVAVSLDAGDSLTLHAYSSNTLAGGIDLVVSRPTNTPTSLMVTLDGTDVSAGFTTVAADKEINIVMDVHNDENPAHVLIWPKGETAFSTTTTLENSDDSGSVTHQGAGAFWGLSLVGATVTQAQASTDRFSD